MRAGVRAWLLGAMSIAKEVARLVLHHPITGILAVPVDDAGHIVMMRRRDTGTWCLPGGAVDWGETLLEALGRELLEETGHRLLHINHLIGIYSDPARDPRMHAITIVVEARVAAPTTLEALNPLEVLDVKSFEPGALPTEVAFDTRRMLDDYFKKAAPVLA